MIRDLGNMKVLKEKDKKVEYVVIKIGDKVYSTTFSEIKTGKDIDISKLQLVDTKGIGKQQNLWIKGKLTEGKNHKKLEKKQQFELNIYVHNSAYVHGVT